VGLIKDFAELKLFLGIIYGQEEIYEKAKQDLREVFGKFDKEFAALDFKNTNYYEEEMGGGLKRRFLSVQNKIRAENFYQAKLRANEVEEKYLIKRKRTINIDPGAVTLHNVMLLTTKNFAHRIPLQKGIYAEVTLIYKAQKGFEALPWTYPDYESAKYKQILEEIRTL
jgi:hypothetical protein